MNTQFVFDLIKEIEHQKDTKAQGILSGNLTSYEEYRAAVAHYQALRSTVTTIKELAKKAQIDE